MAIVHIVLFKLKSSLDEAGRKDVSEHSTRGEQEVLLNVVQLKQTKFCDDMLSLKDTCLHPSSNRPYIVSSSGGEDNSPEGAQVRIAIRPHMQIEY